LLKEDDGYWIGLKNEYITNSFHISEVKTKCCEPLNNYLMQHGELILADEIDDREVKRNLEELGAVICIPLIGKEGLIGMLNIGNKLSEDPYSVEDLELLSTLVNQATIAIENAKLVDKEKDMMQRLDQSKRLASLGGFASRLIHEIRNPLVSIKAFFQVFSDKNENEDDKRELSELASQEMLRIEGLLDNLLNFARPPKPKFLHEDINEILDETIQQLKPEMALRQIGLYVERKEKDIPKIMLDRKQIKQVFLNIIYNAMQAMKEKGGKLVITIDGNTSENKLVVKFQDNGCGIHPQDINKLFDPFYSTKSGGTGLGLAVSYNIINSHKGNINVASEPGKGTIIEISLPIL
jgi:signal transduction histidine kinase